MAWPHFALSMNKPSADALVRWYDPTARRRRRDRLDFEDFNPRDGRLSHQDRANESDPNAAIYVRALMRVFSCMPKHTGGESRVKTLKVESETLNADIDLTIASTASFVISP